MKNHSRTHVLYAVLISMALIMQPQAADASWLSDIKNKVVKHQEDKLNIAKKATKAVVDHQNDKLKLAKKVTNAAIEREREKLNFAKKLSDAAIAREQEKLKIAKKAVELGIEREKEKFNIANKVATAVAERQEDKFDAVKKLTDAAARREQEKFDFAKKAAEVKLERDKEKLKIAEHVTQVAIAREQEKLRIAETAAHVAIAREKEKLTLAERTHDEVKKAETAYARAKQNLANAKANHMSAFMIAASERALKNAEANLQNKQQVLARFENLNQEVVENEPQVLPASPEPENVATGGGVPTQEALPAGAVEQALADMGISSDDIEIVETHPQVVDNGFKEAVNEPQVLPANPEPESVVAVGDASSSAAPVDAAANVATAPAPVKDKKVTAAEKAVKSAERTLERAKKNLANAQQRNMPKYQVAAYARALKNAESQLAKKQLALAGLTPPQDLAENTAANTTNAVDTNAAEVKDTAEAPEVLPANPEPEVVVAGDEAPASTSPALYDPAIADASEANSNDAAPVDTASSDVAEPEPVENTPAVEVSSNTEAATNDVAPAVDAAQNDANQAAKAAAEKKLAAADQAVARAQNNLERARQSEMPPATIAAYEKRLVAAEQGYERAKTELALLEPRQEVVQAYNEVLESRDALVQASTAGVDKETLGELTQDFADAKAAYEKEQAELKAALEEEAKQLAQAPRRASNNKAECIFYCDSTTISQLRAEAD